MKNKLRKGCAVAVIILFLGIAFASSINANITRESELARNTIWIGVEYTFYYTYEDPEGDKWYVMVSWGDGTYSGWMGPYSSGVAVIQAHKWNTQNTYIIRAKAKDVNGEESDWAYLEVTMPKTKPFIFNLPLLSWLFERFPLLYRLLNIFDWRPAQEPYDIGV